jgi:hypothetical protein
VQTTHDATTSINTLPVKKTKSVGTWTSFVELELSTSTAGQKGPLVRNRLSKERHFQTDSFLYEGARFSQHIGVLTMPMHEIHEIYLSNFSIVHIAVDPSVIALSSSAVSTCTRTVVVIVLAWHQDQTPKASETLPEMFFWSLMMMVATMIKVNDYVEMMRN